MTLPGSELADFGWSDFFASQLDAGEQTACLPVRVTAVHRDRMHVIGPSCDRLISRFAETEGDGAAVATVGDWLLLDAQTMRPSRLLRRKSLFKRRAAGSGRRLQLIAANVDTLFIVSSCNQDFNVARLERYLALASEAQVTPVVVLTKADLADDTDGFVRKTAELLPGLQVQVMDARSTDSVAGLAPWCGRGQTVALVGSSGVGKSTLVNTLTNSDRIATRGVREHDDRGRHTTTGRALHRLPAGAWLIDTPGMRELQLTDVQSGLEDVFGDVVALATGCRFADCRHETEPGCAVAAAIASGELDAARVKRWSKLASENARNTRSLSERRPRAGSGSKQARRTGKHDASDGAD